MKNLRQLTNNNIIYFILPLLISFLFSRISISWFLISNFNNEVYNLYHQLWLNTVFIVSVFLLIWLYQWDKKWRNLIYKTNNRNLKSRLYGINYSLNILFTGIISLISLLFIIIFSLLTLKNSSDINSLYFQTLEIIRNTIFYKWQFLLLFSPLILIKYSQSLLLLISRVFFFVCIGYLWRYNIVDQSNFYFNFFNVANSLDIRLLFGFVSIFLLNNTSLSYWYFLTHGNNLSDWSCEQITVKIIYYLILKYTILAFIFSFLVGIYN